MTDATYPADDYAAGAETARSARPGPRHTSGYGTEAGEEPREEPDSGAASAWPAMSWPGVVRPAGWFLSASGEAAPPVRTDTEPVRSDAADRADREPADDPGYRPAAQWPADPQPTSVYLAPPHPSWPAGQPDDTRQASVLGPTEALRGRAGGPGFAVPPGAVAGLLDPAQRSGWQLARDVWQDSGIDWERAAGQQDLAPAYDMPGEAVPTRFDLPVVSPAAAESEPSGPAPWPGDDWQPRAHQPYDRQPYTGWSEYPEEGFGSQAWPASDRGEGTLPPLVGAMPLGAPVAVGPPAQEAGQLLPREPRAVAEPDELFRAWEGSVRRAARPRAGSSRRRRQAWQVAKIGVPAAVLVTVGAGALMMLTGKANDMLAVRANTTPAGNGSGNGGAQVPAAFTGYPGQHGVVTVGSLTTAAGAQLAVGSADGHPAIWRRPGTGSAGGTGGSAGAGTWTLVSQTSPAVAKLPGMSSLSAVAHGPAGWIAVGQTVSGATTTPVVLTSADGVSWQPLTTLASLAPPGTRFAGVAAAHGGYAVVGRQVAGGRTFAVMWWSADLKTWQSASNGGLDGRLKPSAAYAVASTASGFVAVGSHGTSPMIWTSPDGRRWTGYDVPMPAGALSATLRVATASGARVAAAGYAVTRTGNVPVAVVSTNGGAEWREVVLAAPGGAGVVNALTVAANGFVAAGQAGPMSARGAVTWSTTDGLSWSAATAAGGGATAITALTTTGGTVLGVAQRGAGPTAVTITAP